MSRFKLLICIVHLSIFTFAQNDLDAIRYSRNTVGGSARFTGMGGAFGAVGADLSCAAFNPAGLGIFRKGEISFSGSIKLASNTANIYTTNTLANNAYFAFNNFGIAFAWAASNDPESRNVFSFNNSQVQNFNNSTTMSGYTKNSSIVTDMKMLADKAGDINNLNYSYEGLAYNTFLLDDDGSTFNALVDPKRTVLQTREIVTSGRTNELNFSYAYSYKDKYYFGASVGVPRVEYESTTSHSESDNKDSMRVTFTSPTTYSTTYIDGLPNLHTYYDARLGFNNLIYTEYFKTKGNGLNLKIGGIARVNDVVRLGLYYHTPTIYFLNDTYYNTMIASFDKNPSSPDTDKNPPDGGYFEYRIITPSRVSANAAFVIKKLAVIAVDYEVINYATVSLLSDKASVFAGINSTIKTKYNIGHNVRVGAEVNIKPVMLRAGYSMNGSPFGDAFNADFVRHTVSLGLGFRTKGKWYFDFFWAKSLTTEEYFLFTTNNTKAKLSLNASSLGATVGIKF